MVERRGGRGGVPAGGGGGVPHGAVAGPAGPALGGRTRTDARSPSGNDMTSHILLYFTHFTFINVSEV